MNEKSALVSILFYGAIFGAGFLVNWLIESRKIIKAKNRADQIIRSSKKDAANIKRDSLLESKEAILKVRNEFEKEIRESKRELLNSERRMQQRQNTLDRKFDQVEQREKEFENREKEVQRQMEKVKKTEQRYEDIIAEQVSKLESISAMSREEAIGELKEQLYTQARNEAAAAIKKIDDQSQAQAQKNAQKVIGLPYRDAPPTPSRNLPCRS
jgi:ribonuclease Y